MAIRLSGLTRMKTREQYQPYMDLVETALAGRRWHLGGSAKRGDKEKFGDLDYMVQIEKESDKDDICIALMDAGWRKFKDRGYMHVYVIMEDDDAAELDLFFPTKEQWGTAELFITGSKYWNNHIRWRLGNLDMHWDNVLWFEDSVGNKFTFPTEQEALDFVDVGWAPPSERGLNFPMLDSNGRLLKYL